MNDSTGQTSVQHWYLHIDLDAFFASVEQLDHPEYRGKPVIVGGKPEDRRGVVSTCSYEARKFGVHSAMPTFQAYKLCPQGIFVHPNMSRYHELSYAIMEIFRKYSPDVDQMSVDEAFVDITGTEKLFGKPEDTALKIKKEVKERTGLTVSIGLAANKYIAKIASGYSKPDGFYMVLPGQEQDFMLSLPLSKLWGAGEKTQQVLIKNGIKSTRDLYQRDLQQLEFIFGKNTASFLYNAVRGQNTDSFSRITKSHSISNERTFSFDIYDVYTIETYILELSQYVLFRLLKEGGFSRTVFIKIRYEDFSTTSVQQTFDAPVLTVDTFYRSLITLFENKYQKGRGIRLIGVGFDNIEAEDRCHQYSLFEEDDEKKQKIEQAILKLENKHPEIKIHKARILTNSTKAIICSLLLALGFTNQKAIAQDDSNLKTVETDSKTSQVTPTTENGEQPLVLYNWKLSDKDKVDFLVSGYWLMSLEYSASANLSDDFLISSSLPVFSQEIDIYTWLLLNNKWSFEADFADEFKKNTFALGYTGTNVLKYGRLSNRKIIMPDYYSAQALGYGLGGGSNQAPGISLHFEDPVNSRWSGDFLFRYDMTKSQSATYYGTNVVTDANIFLSAFEYGQTFILPEDCFDILHDVQNIYVESSSGTYVDSNCKKFEKLSTTQFMTFLTEGKIILADSANAALQDNKIPTVLITFSETDDVDKIIKATGSYTDESSFAGKIQSFFNTKKSISLDDYSYSLKNSIENTPALVLQNSQGFSPYLSANTYDVGIISQADTYIISKYSEAINSLYETWGNNEELSQESENFFSPNHSYVSVKKTDVTDEDLQKPENRYPFGDTNPEIYLNLNTDTEDILLVRTYENTTEYNIGTDASANSIQVYINGILDSLASYDENTGVITLNQSISENDKIYILWQEDDTSVGNGTLSAGTGFTYNFTPELKGDAAVTFRWPLNSNAKYSTVETPMDGFGAFSAGLAYVKEKENLKIDLENKSAISLQTDNPTGTLLVSTTSDTIPVTCYLSQNDGYITKTTPVLNLSSEKIYLDENKNCTVKNHKGSADSSITGYKVPLEWILSDEETGNWASLDIKLEDTTTLAAASTFELALKPSFTEQPILTDYDVYLQLGVTASEEFTGEDSTSIPTWKISELSSKTLNSIDITSSSWQTVSVLLDDKDRAKLISCHDARLIIVSTENPTVLNGTIFAGPYEEHQQSIYAYGDSNISIYTDSVLSEAASSSLFSTDDYASRIYFQTETPELILSKDQTNLSAVSYFKAADFSSYNSINFDFAFEELSTVEKEFQDEEAPQISFILDTSSDDYNSSIKTALQIDLYNLFNYIDTTFAYHTMTYNLQNKKLYLDDTEINSADYDVKLNKSVKPTRQKVVLSTAYDGKLCTKGNFYISNLYYKNSSPYVTAQNNIYANIEKSGIILAYKDFTILEDGKLNANSNQKASLFSDSGNQENVQITATGDGEITVAGVTVSSTIDADYLSSDNADSILNFGGHSLKTKEKLFSILNFSENYNFYKNDDQTAKNDSLTLDFNSIKLPVIMNCDFIASQNDSIQNQTVNLESESNFNIKENSFKINAKVNAAQKLKEQTSEEEFFDINNYFVNWYDISKLQFSTGNSLASSRSTDYNLLLSDSWKNFSPSFEYEIQSENQSTVKNNFTDTTKLIFKFPVTFTNNSFYMNLTHTGIGLQTSVSENYINDTQKLLETTIKDRGWFYSSIPFYELFTKKKGNHLFAVRNDLDSQYLLFNSKYELGWKRKLSNKLTDLIIPSSTIFSVSREIKASDTLSDLYQLKTVITNTALNNFGSKSSLKLFKWYEQDEILTSLTGIVKIPADLIENTTCEISAYSQLLLFFMNSGTLKNTMDFTMESDFDWNYKISTVYSRRTQNSLILPLIKLCVKDDNNTQFKCTRKDSFYVTLNETDQINKQKYEYLHSMEVSFLNYYTINCSAGLDYTHTENSGDSANMSLSVGGKMEF